MTEEAYGVQYQLLSGTIAAGRLNKARNMFLGKNEVTDNALVAVAQYVDMEYEGGVTFKDQDGTEWTIRTERGKP